MVYLYRRNRGSFSPNLYLAKAFSDKDASATTQFELVLRKHFGSWAVNVLRKHRRRPKLRDARAPR